MALLHSDDEILYFKVIWSKFEKWPKMVKLQGVISRHRIGIFQNFITFVNRLSWRLNDVIFRKIWNLRFFCCDTAYWKMVVSYRQRLSSSLLPYILSFFMHFSTKIVNLNKERLFSHTGNEEKCKKIKHFTLWLESH